jgi:hypothetical protein
VNLVNTTLVVTRIDILEGWNAIFYVDILFDHPQTVYLFEEIVPPSGMADAYVMSETDKILDSRDLQYHTNGGW